MSQQTLYFNWEEVDLLKQALNDLEKVSWIEEATHTFHSSDDELVTIAWNRNGIAIQYSMLFTGLVDSNAEKLSAAIADKTHK